MLLRDVTTLLQNIGENIRELCYWKSGYLINYAFMNHTILLISTASKLKVVYFVGYLKVKSRLMIFDRHVVLKYHHRNRRFWQDILWIQ